MTFFEQKILNALENPQYTWRTIEGIANEIREDPWQIYKALHDQGRMPTVIKHCTGTKDGEELFTTKKRYYEFASWWDRLLTGITNSWC